MKKENEKGEEKYIKLSDGREVRKGPWVYYHPFDKQLEVNIFAVQPGETLFNTVRNEPVGDNLIVLKARIFRPIGNIALPAFEVPNKELWTKDLTDAVVNALRESSKDHKDAIEYIISKLTAKEKELVLEDGRKIVGDLEHEIKWVAHEEGESLIIFGNIKEPRKENLKKAVLFTIKELDTSGYPRFFALNQHGVKNKEFWCKKVMLLVISYLNLLASFAAYPINEQIQKAVKELNECSERKVTAEFIYRKLIGLDPTAMNDPRILKALELIEEVNQQHA